MGKAKRQRLQRLRAMQNRRETSLMPTRELVDYFAMRAERIRGMVPG